MNISLIHAFEVITFLLIMGGFFQVIKLYRQSKANYLQAKKRNTRLVAPSSASNKKSDFKDINRIYRLSENYSLQGLPLPEVSFTENLSVSTAPFSNKVHQSNRAHQSKHKAILNDYIDDFFFDSSPQFFHEAEVVEFKNYKIDSNADDEFITVIDEHDEIIRAFEALERNACSNRLVS